MRTLRSGGVVLTCAAALLSGCGWLAEPADPEPVTAVQATPSTAAAPPPLPAEPVEPVEVAAARLADGERGLAFTGTVRATRSAVVAGLPPLPGPVADDCGLPGDGSVRTVTVDVTFANTSPGKGAPMAGLAATATLTGADGGPPGAGTAVLVESSAPGARRCQEGDAPASDGFAAYASAGDEMTVAVHVVTRDAAPATDLVLRLSGLRNEAGSNATGPWDEVTAGLGGCPDDPAVLCVPLG